MRGIKLKQSIELFGFKEGFKFWFKWSFIEPVEMWYWLNISHKPYCTYYGFYCKKENCPHKHLTKKRDIKNNWEESKKEMDRVEVGENGLCVYCGKEKSNY